MVQLLLVIIYLSFISLGLPDALLGAAWPTMQASFGVPLSYAGIVSMIIAAGTILSSLCSDRISARLSTGKITLISVASTAVALYGFSASDAFWKICLWAAPYGLGAGSVDAALNNYVALHYESRHMSWLHCMWGVGATTGPYLMGLALTGGRAWNMGYLYIAVIQSVLTVILLISLPLWKKGTSEAEKRRDALPLRQVVRFPGAKAVMLCFFCYCGVEQTAGLWFGSYLTLQRGFSPQTAAGLSGMFFMGIAAGRALSGFLTLRLSDRAMIRLGMALIAVGIGLVLWPGKEICLIGFILIGLGCAPIYPCIIHSTPAHFGAERTPAIIGIQMASAYVGTLSMPPLFGQLAGRIGTAWLPAFLALLLVVMIVMYERLNQQTEGNR